MNLRFSLGASILLIIAVCSTVFAQKPPIPQYDVPFQKWRYNNSSCGTYVANSSSMICIPPEAIVDANGNLVKGNITIQYREFETPIDMVLGGLQMTAKEAGQDIQLESSGMFQIEAYKGNQKLYLADGKQIDVKLRTWNPLPGDRLWQYDEDGDFWKPLDEPIQRKEEPLQEADNADMWGQTAQAEGDDWDGEWDPETDWAWDEGADWDAPVSAADSNETWFRRRELTKRVFNNLGIREFGIYNCDRQLGEEDERVPMIANVKLPGSLEKDENRTVYLVFEGFNTVIYATDDYLKKYFYLLKDREWRMFSIYGNEQLAMYTSADFAPKNVNNFKDRTCTFALKKIDVQGSSAEAFRNALSLR